MSADYKENIREFWEIDEIIEGLGDLYFNNNYLLDSSWVQRKELTPRLFEIAENAENSEGRVKLEAGLLLMHMGEPLGTRGFTQPLENGDERLLRSAMVALNHSLTGRNKESQSINSQIKRQFTPDLDLLFSAIEEIISNPNQKNTVLRFAVKNLINIDFEKAKSVVKPLLESGADDVKASIILAFSSFDQDEGCISQSKNLLERNSNPRSVVDALNQYCGGANNESISQSSELLLDYIANNIAVSDWNVVSILKSATEGLIKANHPKSKEACEQILNGPIDDSRRSDAWIQIIKLEEGANGRRMTSALADPTLRIAAAEIILSKNYAKNIQDLSQLIYKALESEKSDRVRSRLLQAYLSLPGTAEHLPSKVLEHSSPDDLMRIHWAKNNIDLNRALEIIDSIGLELPLSSKENEQIRDDWESGEQEPTAILTRLFDRRTVWFDTEAGSVPPNYADLFEAFSKSSGGEFIPKNISQAPQNDRILLSFLLGEKHFEIEVAEIGDWYDVSSFLVGINNSLASLNVKEQFIPIYTGDQTALMIFAKKELFYEVADALQFPIEQNVSNSMQRGMQFEKHVINTLRNQQPNQGLFFRFLSWFFGNT